MNEDLITDVLVEQQLLNNIDLTLYENPSSEELSKLHLTVIIYKEFQETLLTKNRRIAEVNREVQQ